MRQVKNQRRRLGKPRLLIVGCGDVGLRILSRIKHRYRVYASTTTASKLELLRHAGAVPLLADLDSRASLRRLRGLADRLIYLAPPAPQGEHDPRVTRLGLALHHQNGPAWRRPARSAFNGETSPWSGNRHDHWPRFVYASTTGVYGDHRGGRVNETTPVAALTARAIRRVDAERRARALGAAVLRVPGIYAQDRLPLSRLQQGLPVLVADQDVMTNHIHADDLARVALRALTHAGARRLYNVVDDSQLLMGDFMDRVADTFNLPRPPRLARALIVTRLSAAMMSFMNESRRIDNRRMKQELAVRLLWPAVDDCLRTLAVGKSSP